MTATPLVLQQGVLVGNVVNPIVGAVTAFTQITNAAFTNSDTSSHTLTVYISRDGAAGGAATLIVDAQVIAPTRTWVAQQLWGKNLNIGDSLTAVADAGGVINAIVDGFTVT